MSTVHVRMVKHFHMFWSTMGYVFLLLEPSYRSCFLYFMGNCLWNENRFTKCGQPNHL